MATTMSMAQPFFPITLASVPLGEAFKFQFCGLPEVQSQSERYSPVYEQLFVLSHVSILGNYHVGNCPCLCLEVHL